LLAAVRPPRRCDPEAAPDAPGFLTVPPFYGDRTAYAAATVSLRNFQGSVTDMAEFYFVTQDAVYAKCVVRLLESWASKDALLNFEHSNGRQAWYDSVWTTVSAALAYSIVRDDPGVQAESRQTIDDWLNNVTKKHLSISGGPRDCCNNHFYWRGLEAAIVGVVTNDQALFSAAIKTYRRALSSIDKDGSLPLEMARGERAIHYQNFAILPLVYIAEIANHQGENLYAVTVDGRSLHAAVGFLLDAIHNPRIVEIYTDKPQDLSFVDQRGELNWMEPYNARFSDPRIEAILAGRRPVIHRYGGGNSTLYFYRPRAA
jgi:poly(beta-D-mannuronate) lyase